jgi:hypothetical protein
LFEVLSFQPVPPQFPEFPPVVFVEGSVVVVVEVEGVAGVSAAAGLAAVEGCADGSVVVPVEGAVDAAAGSGDVPDAAVEDDPLVPVDVVDVAGVDTGVAAGAAVSCEGVDTGPEFPLDPELVPVVLSTEEDEVFCTGVAPIFDAADVTAEVAA